MQFFYFKHTLILTLLATTLFSCGGSGGSGGTGDGGTDVDISEPDNFNPDSVSEEALLDVFPETSDEVEGQSIERDDDELNLYLEPEVYEIESASIETNTFQDASVSGDNGAASFLVFDTGSAIGLAGWHDVDGERSYFTAFDGIAVTTLPSNKVYYSGQYAIMDQDSKVIQEWPMEILIDFADISQSYAINAGDQEEIRMYFRDLTGQGFTGSISDPNHDSSLSVFELFGTNGEIIFGGYSNEFGTGLLHADAVGSPP